MLRRFFGRLHQRTTERALSAHAFVNLPQLLS